jgi:hypothetical protein
MENKNSVTIESDNSSRSSKVKKSKFELPKITEGIFNAIASITVLTGSVLTAQNVFAEMKTGAIMDTQFTGFGSSITIFDKQRECVVTNEHVVPKSRNDPQKTEYYNIPNDPLNIDKTILDSNLLPNNIFFYKYPGKNVIYSSLFDAAVVSNPVRPCTKELIINQIGQDNILTIDELRNRNENEYKNQTIRITTHRNIDIKEMYDNKSHDVNGKPIGITLMYYNQVVFLNFSNLSHNNGLDPNQFLLPGASGSPSYTKHKDNKE